MKMDKKTSQNKRKRETDCKKKKDDLDKYFLEINKSYDLYSKYKKIHKELCSILLKLLKFIKWRDHDNELERILKEIRESELKISHYETNNYVKKNSTKQFRDIIRRYFRDFRTMIISLKDIVKRLADQAEGKSKFPWKDHKAMMDKYEEDFDTFHFTRWRIQNIAKMMKSGLSRAEKYLDSRTKQEALKIMKERGLTEEEALKLAEGRELTDKEMDEFFKLL